MSNHFTAVGFDVFDQESLDRTIGELSKSATRDKGRRGTRLFWSDESGAALAMFLGKRGRIPCSKPTFVTTNTIAARNAIALPEVDGCPYCALVQVEVLEGDDMAYPLLVELDDPHLKLPDTEGRFDLRVTAFAEDSRTWPNEDAYFEDTKDAEVPFGPRSLIPTGMFGEDDGRRASALITGSVIESERRTNSYSGEPFDWCRLETYACTLDVVRAPQLDALPTGTVMQGSFWLVGGRAS